MSWTSTVHPGLVEESVTKEFMMNTGQFDCFLSDALDKTFKLSARFKVIADRDHESRAKLQITMPVAPCSASIFQ